MADPKDEGMTVWNFPEVTSDTSTDEEDEEFAEEVHANIDDLTTTTVSKVEEAKQSTAEDELIALKAIYEKKILTASKLISKLKETRPLIDNEVMEVIEDIIRKICKKIIHKEIALDPQLLSNMITELKNQVANQAGVIMIYLSKVDFERLDIDKQDMGTLFNIQDNLNEGDIIVKCNTAEIHAQLIARIEKLLRKET